MTSPLVLVGLLSSESQSLSPLLSDAPLDLDQPSKWHHRNVPIAPSSRSLENTVHHPSDTTYALY
jgi:hypothetical protein